MADEELKRGTSRGNSEEGYAAAAWRLPSLSGSRVRLRPVLPSDLEWLYLAASEPETSLKWRLQGSSISFDRFAEFLWRGTEVQFLILDRASDVRLGLVQLIRYDPRASTAHLSAFVSKEAQGLGWPLEGVLLFIDYVFTSISIRKIYLESLTPAYEQYASIVGTYLELEGVLREHDVFDGQLVDLHISSLTRSRWIAERGNLGFS